MGGAPVDGPGSSRTRPKMSINDFREAIKTAESFAEYESRARNEGRDFKVPVHRNNHRFEARAPRGRHPDAAATPRARKKGLRACSVPSCHGGCATCMPRLAPRQKAIVNLCFARYNQLKRERAALAPVIGEETGFYTMDGEGRETKVRPSPRAARDARRLVPSRSLPRAGPRRDPQGAREQAGPLRSLSESGKVPGYLWAQMGLRQSRFSGKAGDQDDERVRVEARARGEPRRVRWRPPRHVRVLYRGYQREQ